VSGERRSSTCGERNWPVGRRTFTGFDGTLAGLIDPPPGDISFVANGVELDDLDDGAPRFTAVR
jgi:hypothetical protein